MRIVLALAGLAFGLAGCTSSTTPAPAAAARAVPGCEGYPRSGTSSVTVCEARHFGPLASTGAASFETGAGDIVVEGSGRTTLDVDAFVYATAPTEETARELAAQVVVHSEDNDFYATGPAAPSTGCNVTLADNCLGSGSTEQGSSGTWYVRFAAQIPGATNLWASAGSGEVEVRNVDGVGYVHSGSGAVFLSNLGGELTADSGSEPIVLDLGGKAWRGAGATVTSGSGSVIFLVPGDYSAKFDLQSGSGMIRSEFSGHESQGGHHVESVGSGGATLAADTGSGDISLLRK